MGFHRIQHCIGDSSLVSLVIPPSAFLLDERVFPSLGILRVAQSLESRGYEVKVVDFSGVSDYVERAAKLPQGIFGITATTPQLPAAISIAQVLNGKKILGGPHVTLTNASRKAGNPRAVAAWDSLRSHFDVLVAGDGEQAIFEAIEGEGLVDADDPKSHLFIKGGEVPRPARHLIDMDSYHYEIDGAKATSLIAQLGCPFGCGFCGGRASPSFRRVRMRDTASIVAEMSDLWESYGYTGFMFYDDELNVNPRMVELMRAIPRGFHLRGFIKAELFTEEQAEAMAEAGFKWILTGFESGSPRILKNIEKRAKIEDNTRCAQIARKHGLKVKALMSLGHPGESRETVAETVDWVRSISPEDFDMTIITPYPGTPYYDKAVKHGDYWKYEVNGDALYSVDVDYTKVADYYKGSPLDGYRSYVSTDYLSADELVGLRNEAEALLRRELGIPYPARSYEHSMGQN